jgi:hypothetical protein
MGANFQILYPKYAGFDFHLTYSMVPQSEIGRKHCPLVQQTNLGKEFYLKIPKSGRASGWVQIL